MSSSERGAEPSNPHDLRQQAEQRVRQHRPAELSSLAADDLQTLVHELEVHQVELEVQNEELRRAQAELAEAHGRYEDLYERAPVGYLTLDGQGVIRQANLAMARLCGVDRLSLLGQRIERLMVREDRDSCYVFLRETAASGDVRAREFRLAVADGQTRWVSATASPLEGPGGQTGGFRLTLSDISERKQVEKQLQELTATLEQRVVERTAQLQTLTALLSQAEHRERHRLAKILHDDLQQLLVGTKFQLGVLRKSAADESLLPAIQRMSELLDESVATSRSLTAEMSPPILYQGTMRQVLAWLARWMREKHGLSVQLDVDERANPQREEIRVLVFEAVRELLLNIVKHAGVDSGTICLTRVGGERLQVVIADEGAGFDPAHVRTADTSRFGLFAIRQRLGLLGGQVDIDSAPGKGTRVTLVVPTDLANTDTARLAPLAIAQTIRPASMTGHPSGQAVEGEQTIRVLLADDHAVVREGLARLLDLQPGIEVIARASDGQQALDLAVQLQPDMVIMDVSMPRLSGMEATRQILAQRPGTRVIGLSMHADSDIAAAMREAGAVAYLAKSAQPEVLVATIRECAAKNS